MILVTGAGGTVGSELVKTLSASGVKFRAAYHSPDKADAAKRQGIDAVPIDYAAPKTVASALEGADHLFLLGAGAVGQTEAEIGVVREARRRGVAHIAQSAFYMASRGCRISHVDVRDIAAVAAITLTRPGHAGRFR